MTPARTLVAQLQSEFPDSTHLDLIGMRGSDDRRVWDHAGANDFVIVSKDSDFRQLSFLFGPPTKVIGYPSEMLGPRTYWGTLRCAFA